MCPQEQQAPADANGADALRPLETTTECFDLGIWEDIFEEKAARKLVRDMTPPSSLSSWRKRNLKLF